MNKIIVFSLSILVIFAISLFLITSTITASAQIVDSVAVTTDKTSYDYGDTIFVTGQVSDLLSGVPILLRVISPNGDLVTIAQIDVGSDKKFSTELIAGGPLMRDGGTYTINVFYGSQSHTTETTFTFSGSTGTIPYVETTIAVSGTDFMVNYKITGGKIGGITHDVASHSLLIAITASHDGLLVITLPRSLIDAKSGNQDDVFFVLVDGVEVYFEETNTSADRTLTIQFPSGTEEIEILGTIVNSGSSTQIINDAVLTLTLEKTSSPTSIRVFPKYLNDFGTELLFTISGSEEFIEIYIDNQYVKSVKPNQWSADIVVGYGSHDAYAKSPEFSILNGAEKYLSAKSSTQNISLPPPSNNTPNIAVPSSTVSSGTQDPSGFIALGIIAVVGVIVGIIIMKRRKISTHPGKTQTDDTQIWK